MEETMRKLLAVLLVLVVSSAAIVGCKKSGTTAGSGSGDIRIGLSNCKVDESDWRMANTKSIQGAFTHAGYQVILADSNNDAAKQLADVQGFIDMEVDYILVAAVNVDGWDTVLRNAQRAGIPVILFDRTVNAPENLYTCWVGPDFYLEGVKATEWMVKRFGDNEVNVVNIQGQLGTSAQIERTRALVDAVANNGNWNLLAQQTGDWGTPQAKQIMTSWIQQYGNRINCVYAENDNMADGAIQALQEAGISVGGADGVAVISFDANKPYLQMTLAGLINCNVECNPLHGPKLKEIIDNMQKGIMPQRIEIVNEEAFYWDTITQAIIDARQY
jgi:simple sugar transport system substrate-binding protein